MKTVEQPVVAYYRLSKESRNKLNYGLDAQRAIINNYYGGRVVMEYTEIISGKRADNRVELQKAISYCKENGYYLVVAKVDRLSRNTEDVLQIWKELNHKLYCCDIPGKLDKFTLTLYAMIADRERELISIRVTDGIKQAKLRGKTPGNPNAGQMGKVHLVKAHQANRHKADTNHANVKASKLVCMLRQQGKTFKQIAEVLNQDGFKTVRGGEYYATTVKLLFERYCNK